MKDGMIVVTGAAGALGKAVSAQLTKAGRKVIGLDLAPVSAGGDLAHAYGGVNLTDATAVQGVFQSIRDQGIKVAGLANIAGGFHWEPVLSAGPEIWDKMYAMNVKSAVTACVAAIPLLKETNGAIVNVGAAAAERAGMGMGAYAASKSAVAKLTESLAEELKDEGVRVNAVLPSILDTPTNRKDMPDAEFDRWVTPEALSDVVSFLLSDGARAVTGALVRVTGRV